MKPVLVVNRVDRSVTRGTLSRPPPESIDSVDRQVRLIGGRTCQSVTSGFGRQSRYSGQESKKVGARGPIHRVELFVFQGSIPTEQWIPPNGRAAPV